MRKSVEGKRSERGRAQNDRYKATKEAPGGGACKLKDAPGGGVGR